LAILTTTSETFKFYLFYFEKKDSDFECVLTRNRRKAVGEEFEGTIPGITRMQI